MVKRLILPAANVNTNSLVGAVLSESDTVTGLQNGTSYVAFKLSDASVSFTPDLPLSNQNLTGETLDEFSVLLTFEAAAGGSFNLDPYNLPRLVFNVASKGYDDNGNLTTVNRTVYGMRVSRKPHGQETQLDVVDNGNGTLTARIVLSEYIHTPDVITVSTLAGWYTGMAAQSNLPVVNDLAIPYFTPQGTWIRHDREIINSSTYRPKITICHAYARNGRALAAVRFFISDQAGNTVTSLVNSANLETYSASGLSTEYYGNDIDLSTLTQGHVCTVDAEFYPWIGDAFRISVHGEPYPSPNLSVLQFLNNRTGAYGTAYAYVSPTGNDTTGVASSTAATAEAAPFLTLSAAAIAIQNFNNANFGRNNVSGGIIRLLEGVTTMHSNTLLSQRATGEVPLVIESANPANRATTVLTWTAGATNNCPDRFKLKDLTLRKGVATNVTGFSNDATLAALANYTFVTENCVWDLNGNAGGTATITRCGIYWSINDSCTGAMGHLGRLATNCKMTIAIGGRTTGESASSVYHLVAHKDIQSTFGWSLGNADANRLQAQGNIVAYSYLGRNDGSGTTVNTDNITLGPRGFMLLGTIVEHCNNANTSPAVRMSGDGDVTEVRNVHIKACTILGARTNYLYNDIGTAGTTKYGTLGQNIIWQINTKADLFVHPTNGGANANRVLNWGVVNHVGCMYNAYLTGSQSGDTFADGNWVGETRGVGELTGTDATPLLTGFTNDQSGAGAGNGDYHITGTTQIPQVPAVLMPISRNLFGEAKLLNGLDYAGAV